MQRFKNTFYGMRRMFMKDHHFLIHVASAVLAIAFGAILSIGRVEWLFIITAIFLVFVTEAVNTSIEYVVDLVTEEYHELAGHAKDISAFAVITASMYAVITGAVIFIPELLNLI